MIEENEAIMLILGLGILIRILTNFTQTQRIPAFKFLFFGFVSFLGATVATILEGFFFENAFNLLEHLLYLASQIGVTVWIWKICKKSTEGVETE